MQLRLFDDIDERALTPGQVKTFCELLLGCPPLPEPDVDRRAFLDAIDMELAAQPQVFDPISKKMTPGSRPSSSSLACQETEANRESARG